jgi:hypothetical protein
MAKGPDKFEGLNFSLVHEITSLKGNRVLQSDYQMVLHSAGATSTTWQHGWTGQESHLG